MTTFEGPPLGEHEGIGALTLGAFLEEVAAAHGPREALVFDDPLRGGETVRWTYAELRERAREVGRGLVALGVERGDAVGVLMGNRPEAVAALFGAAMAGAVVVPLSTFAPRPELADMLARARVTVVLTQEQLLARGPAADVAALAPALPALTHVVVLDGSEAPRGGIRTPGASEPNDDRPGPVLRRQGAGSAPEAPQNGTATMSWDALRGDGGDGELDRRIAATGPDDTALVIFSSGTTSTPKGVVHRHRAPSLQFWVQAQIFGRHPATRMWSALPLFWTAGLNTAMGATLAAGGCWVVQEAFEPGTALALMSRERVTEPYTLPHQAAALEEHPDWAGTDLSSLTCVYGKSVFARHPTVHGDTGWTMPVGYGLTETCAFFASHWSSTPRELTRASMGRLLPGNRLRVVDPDTGRALGAGEEGELAIAGPTLMQGYLGAAPEDCVDADGFFPTGDAGHVDAEGYLHYAGRRTEMIKTGGANVSPAEIEVQLRACPPVKLSRIVGVPDARLDQVVVACITLKDGATASAEDIRAFLRERVAPYKVPKRVVFFDDGEIPMTRGATKVRDPELLALVQDRLATSPTGDR